LDTSLIYFEGGKVVAESGNVKVYKFNDELYLEIGPGHSLWAISDEIKELSAQISNLPQGDCLEIGLGLGIASNYILAQDIDSLTTIEINSDVINTYKQLNRIIDIRHTIVNASGLDYILSTDRKFDFIFFDFYDLIDEDTLEMLDVYTKVSKRILSDDGIMLAWFDPYTPEEDAEVFFNMFKKGGS